MRPALARLRNHPQLRDLKRLQLNLHRRQLLTEPALLKQLGIAHPLQIGQLLDPPDALLGNPNPRNPHALIAQQKFRIIPAAILLPHEILRRHLHLVEEHLIHLMPAIQQLNRPHGNPGRLHIHQNK